MVNVYSFAAVNELLKEQNIAPLKQLGQNFLIDENVVNRIADSVEGDYVVEIGPGLGALTLALAKRKKRVIAIEIDHGMVSALGHVLEGIDNTTVLHQDVLKTDIKELSETYFGGEPFAVVGNLPYYITSKCILQVLESKAPVTSFTAMVQKEVADRLAANPGGKDYGAITASVRYFGSFSKLFDVSKNCFYPKPEVESAVIQIFPEQQFQVEREVYADIVRTLFSMRRKTVLNNLTAGKKYSKEQAMALLERAGIEKTLRAEMLSPDQFSELSQIIVLDKQK